MNTYTFLALIAISVVPLAIVAGLPKREQFFHNPLVKGFGLGVYASLVLMLLREGLERGGVGTTLIWGAVGLGVSVCIGLVFKEFHHHHNNEEEHKHHTRASMWRILVSDFFHNIVDGIAVISGFALNPVIGFTSFIGVLGHQTIQQAGQQVLLVESGVQSKKAILISLLVSLSIFFGLFFSENESLEAILITLSAGIILWKISTDILHAKWTAKTVFGFFIGVVLLTASLMIIPHAH
jgi:zinc transporter ZupT